MKRILQISMLAASLSLPAVAFASPGRGGRALSPTCAAKRADRIAAHDTDGNGQLSRQERHQLRSQRRQKMLARFDVNRDGTLDQGERTAMRQQRSTARFQKLDANGDGAISQAEAKASCSRIGHHFAKVDANGDGAITASEINAAKRQWHHARRRHGHRRAAPAK